MIHGRVDADYSQFSLYAGSGGEVKPFDVGLALEMSGDSVCLTTPRHHGPITVTVEITDHAPPVDPAWDAVVEFSVRTGEDAGVVGWGGDGWIPLPLPPGADLRARYVVLDGDITEERSRADDEYDADRYLIQLWPASPAPAAVVVATSAWSQYWVFGQDAEHAGDEYRDLPAQDALGAVIDRAFADHPEVLAALQAGHERYTSGVIRYVQELERVRAIAAGGYTGPEFDPWTIGQAILDRAATY